MSEKKTARWLDLVSLLAANRYPISRREITDQVKGYRETADKHGADSDAARRMFERDKDELKRWGIEIVTEPLASSDPAEQFGYRLTEDSLYLPYLLLEGDENEVRDPYRGLHSISFSKRDLRVLDRATKRLADREELPLSRHARSLRRKLNFELPLSDEKMEHLFAEPASESVADTLDVLQHGIAEQRAVAVKYHTISRDEVADRVLEPYGLFLNWGKWYCVAQPRDRETRRVFRVDRMREAGPYDGADAAFFAPEGFSVAEYANRPPWALADTAGIDVDVRFAFPDSRWVQSLGLGEVVEGIDADGGALIRFQVRDRNPFLRWLLTYRSQARVESPGEVAAELGELRQRIAALYQDEADG